jgi:hypothetical protein
MATFTYFGYSISLDSWLFVVLEFIITAAICTLFFFFYIRSIQQKAAVIDFYEETLLVPLIVVLVLIITTQIMPHDIITNDPIMATFIISGYDLSLSGIILYSMYKLFEISGLRMENGILQTMSVKQKEQYEYQKGNIDYINEKCHDFKKMINIFNEGGKLSEDRVAELYNKISIYDCYAHTGNEIMDTILSEKSLACEREKISLTYIVDGAGMSFMDTVDICAIFVNMLDNAMEAVLKIPDKNNRIVSLKVSAKGNMLYISSFNTYFEQPMSDGRNFLTTKSDKQAHGFGIKSIRSTVKRLGGEMRIYFENELFNMEILLPIPELKKDV